MIINQHNLMMEVQRLDFSHPDLYEIILLYTRKRLQFNKTWASIEGIWKSTNGPQLPQDTQSILALTSYLFFVEGLYALSLDVIIYNLIKTEHADLLYKHNNYVTKFNELSDVSLYRKAIFLERHNYKEVLNIVKRKLRNAIAHHDFKILEDGTIEYDTKSGKESASRKEIYEMIGNIRLLSSYINERISEALQVSSDILGKKDEK